MKIEMMPKVDELNLLVSDVQQVHFVYEACLPRTEACTRQPINAREIMPWETYVPNSNAGRPSEKANIPV
jgi:hypothetical protein